MHKCKYKKRRFPYNPMKAKVLGFSAQDNQPHAQYKVTEYKITAGMLERNPNKYKGLSVGSIYRDVSGCQCEACMGYLRVMARENPAKFKTLVTPLEPKFFRNKSLPEHAHVRRNYGKTLSRFNFKPF